MGEVSRNAKIDSGTRKRTEITVTGERSLKTDNGKKIVGGKLKMVTFSMTKRTRHEIKRI